MSKSIYEIVSVKKWENYFQLQKRYVWKIVTELYTVDGDTFDTGDVDIDSISEDVLDGSHQTNEGGSEDPNVEEEIFNDDWLDATESNPFGSIVDA